MNVHINELMAYLARLHGDTWTVSTMKALIEREDGLAEPIFNALWAAASNEQRDRVFTGMGHRHAERN